MRERSSFGGLQVPAFADDCVWQNSLEERQGTGEDLPLMTFDVEFRKTDRRQVDAVENVG